MVAQIRELKEWISRMIKKDKSKWLIINAICIMTSVVCIALTFWGNLKNDGVLTTEAYISIIATLIGVSTTIVVAFQIISYFDFKYLRDKVRDIDQFRDELKGELAKIEELENKISLHTSNVYAVIASGDTGSFFRMNMMICSIGMLSKMDLTTIVDSSFLISRYEAILLLLACLEKEKEKRGVEKIHNWIEFASINYPSCIPNYQEIIHKHAEVVYKIESSLPVKQDNINEQTENAQPQ